MARREQFRLPGGTPIETGVDNGQRWFVGYRKGSSMGFTCPVALRRWLGLPLKTPSREAFDAWIATLEEADAAKDQGNLKAGLTGWGPEAHADEQDPALSTRMVM
jgi:hypothetical protein